MRCYFNHREYEKIWVIVQMQFKNSLHGQEDLRNDLEIQTKFLVRWYTIFAR